MILFENSVHKTIFQKVKPRAQKRKTQNDNNFYHKLAGNFHLENFLHIFKN